MSHNGWIEVTKALLVKCCRRAQCCTLISTSGDDRNFDLGLYIAHEVWGCPPAETVCRHYLQSLTAETIKIWKLRTFYLLSLDRCVSWWGLSDILGLSPQPIANTECQRTPLSMIYFIDKHSYRPTCLSRVRSSHKNTLKDIDTWCCPAYTAIACDRQNVSNVWHKVLSLKLQNCLSRSASSKKLLRKSIKCREHRFTARRQRCILVWPSFTLIL